MEAVRVITGRAVPLVRSDVDTDQIIPSDWLKRVERTGFGAGLFSEWRDSSDFVLNQEQFEGAQILVSGPNFGCGSSREHAVWALCDYGMRAVIAPSFGDIFYTNALKNGLLPIRLPVAAVQSLLDAAAAQPGARVIVDLEAQTVTSPGSATHPFDIDPRSRECLLKGIDEIDYTLTQIDAIRAFENRNRGQAPIKDSR